MTKILFLTRSLELGGAETQLAELAIGLARRNVELLVVTFYPNGELEKRLSNFGIPITSLDKKGRWEIWRFVARFFRLVISYQPTHIYAFLTGPNLLAAYIKARRPEINVCWGLRSSVPDRILRNDPLVALMYYALKFLAYLPDLIIVNSRKSMEAHIDLGFPREKLVMIPNGIPTTRFHRDRHAGFSTRKAFDIDQESLVIGMVGRLDPIKGHKIFLAAAHEFLSKNPNTIFLIAASGSISELNELKTIERRLELSDNIRWVLEQHDLKGIYNAMDIFTLPSLSESFPNVLVEAIACEVSCVATDVGDCKLILGSHGKLVKPGNLNQLVNAWQSLLKEKELGLCERSNLLAAKSVVENYSVEKLTSDTIQTLLSIVKR